MRLRLPHPWPYCESFLWAGDGSPLVVAPYLQAAFALAIGGLSPSITQNAITIAEDLIVASFR